MNRATLSTATATDTVYFVNARSGKGRGLTLLAQTKLGTMVQIEPERIREQIEEHLHGHERVVVAGGDGTFSLFIDALFQLNLQDQVSLHLLPLGTGNDLARSLDLLSLPTVDDDDFSAEHFQLRRLPVWRYGDRHFVNYLSWGMDAKMLAEVEACRTRFPRSLFLRKISLTLRSLQHLVYVVRTPSAVEIDGVTYDLHRKAGIIISNLPFYLGGSRISTLAPEDRRLSVTLIHRAGDLLRLGFSRKAGNAEPVIPFIPARHVRLIGPDLPMQIDGEVGIYEETEIVYAGEVGIWGGKNQTS